MTAEIDLRRASATIASLERRLVEICPGSRIEEIRALGIDEGDPDASTTKAIGYGRPLLVRVAANGAERRFVLHTARGDGFGHDRRADRAEEMLLAYDTFGAIPRHVGACDVGTIDDRGELISLRHAGEFYLLTEWAPGSLYADDLRRIARDARCTDEDRRRCDQLASYLADLHARRGGDPGVYRRAIRDAVGHGEGIFGLIDSFPPDVPGAPLRRLYALERAAGTWREKLRGRDHRLVVVHGDFHPFNILFADETELHLLDAARGCHGDAADDAVCLALNYVFFAQGHAHAWSGGLGDLWRRFWSRYLRLTGDLELLEVAPLYLAWRCLVMIHPGWYPSVTEASRDALLSFVEGCLARGRLDPDRAEDIFR